MSGSCVYIFKRIGRRTPGRTRTPITASNFEISGGLTDQLAHVDGTTLNSTKPGGQSQFKGVDTTKKVIRVVSSAKRPSRHHHRRVYDGSNKRTKSSMTTVKEQEEIPYDEDDNQKQKVNFRVSCLEKALERLSKSILIFASKSQLNGNNGEWTNGDDMGKKGGIKMSKGMKKFFAKAGSVAKDVAYEVAKEAIAEKMASGSYDKKKIKRFQNKSRNNIRLRGSGFYRGGISGSGTYVSGPNSATQNELFSRTARTSVVHAGDESDSIYIERIEREVISVYSPSTPANFQLISVPVNPAQSCYSFLSGIAPNYSEYCIQDKVGDGGLIAFYEPAINETSAAVTAGQVGLYMCPNVNDAPPTNSTALVGSHGAISGMPSTNLACGYECDTRKGADGRTFNTRPGALPTGADLQEYDPCVLYIWTRGIPAATYPAGTLLGYVHVYWRMKLLKPRIYSGVGYSALVDSFFATTGLTITAFFGTAPTKGANNGIGCSVTKDASGSVVTFPDNFAGTVNFYLSIRGTGISGYSGVTTSGSISNNNCLWNGATWTNSNYSGSTVSLLRVGSYNVATALTAGGNKLTFSALTGATTVDQCQLIIEMVSPNIPTLGGFVLA